MARINNDKITGVIANKCKVNIAEGIPNQLSNQVVPVINADPQINVKTILATINDGTSANFLSTSTTKETYLCGSAISVNKDANSDSSQVYIDYYDEDGAQKIINHIGLEPLTALQGVRCSETLKYPIKLKKGTLVRLLNASGTASIDINGVIQIYEVETLSKK